MGVLKQIIFVDKLFWDVREFDASISGVGVMGLGVKIMSNL